MICVYEKLTPSGIIWKKSDTMCKRWILLIRLKGPWRGQKGQFTSLSRLNNPWNKNSWRAMVGWGGQIPQREKKSCPNDKRRCRSNLLNDKIFKGHGMLCTWVEKGDGRRKRWIEYVGLVAHSGFETNQPNGKWWGHCNPPESTKDTPCGRLFRGRLNEPD